MQTHKQIGDHGEQLAADYLKRNGYDIRETNFRFGRFGEIDIVAEYHGQIIFIEVKYRSHPGLGYPEESITPQKLHKCLKTIQYYCSKHRILEENIRFDVIAILKGSDRFHLKHYKNVEI